MTRIENMEQLGSAIDLMRKAGTDLRQFEVKAASEGLPGSLAESMSAFANKNGGTIILGIEEKSNFAPVQFDVKKRQAQLAQAARDQLYPALNPSIDVYEFEGLPVIVCNVEELPAREKPCYVKAKGRVRGSYLRTGDGDYLLTPYEIDRLMENELQAARNDCATVEGATIADLDPALLKKWIAQERKDSFGRTASLTDEELMANRNVAEFDDKGHGVPTVAGLLALGKYPQKFFPRLNVVFASYPSSEKGASGAVRFIDSANIDGPIPEMVLSTIQVISRNIRHGGIVEGALRDDIADYPLPAVREAVANALMHRDYSVEGQGSPVTVDLYPDRLEISNPGGLFGHLTVDRLGAPGATASRNQFLSRILGEVPYTDYDGREGKVVENRGTGYPTIRQSLQDALMPDPVVKNDLGSFTIVLRHRKMSAQEAQGVSRDEVTDAILAYLGERESASSKEIAQAAGLHVKTIRKHLGRLQEDHLVEAIGPKNSPTRRYRINL